MTPEIDAAASDTAIDPHGSEPARERRRRRLVHYARLGQALAAGVLAALAHPPFGFVLGLIGYPLLMLLAERSVRVRGAFWMGWLAGFGYFFISCWWVAEAFLVNKDQAWMAPFAASLLPMGLGLFWGAAAAIYRRWAPAGVSRVLFFAATFALLEWLRGHILTGFPWNPAGASWAAGTAASQFAAVAGVYGLGLVTVAAVAAFAPLAGPGPRKARIGVAALGALVLGALILGGAVRLAGARTQFTDTLVRIVQADVQQEAKWTPENYQSIVRRYVNLTARPGAALPDVVIWPEGALPATANDVFADGSPDGAAIANALAPGQTLLMGLSRGEPAADAEGGARYYNSLFALHDIGAGLRIAAVYDKHRLVPFGEYLPLGPLMSRLGVRSLVHVPADFSAGPSPAPLDLPDAPRVQPLICYESLYPGFTAGTGAGRPLWIANVSNDSWFGQTSGPLQHLNLASYRAIETGLPVARATPTGVSAMIDPWGRIVGDKRLDSGESGVIDVRLPRALDVTIYGRLGDTLFWLAVVAGLLVATPWRRLKRRAEASPDA